MTDNSINTKPQYLDYSEVVQVWTINGIPVRVLVPIIDDEPVMIDLRKLPDAGNILCSLIDELTQYNAGRAIESAEPVVIAAIDAGDLAHRLRYQLEVNFQRTTHSQLHDARVQRAIDLLRMELLHFS